MRPLSIMLLNSECHFDGQAYLVTDVDSVAQLISKGVFLQARALHIDPDRNLDLSFCRHATNSNLIFHMKIRARFGQF